MGMEFCFVFSPYRILLGKEKMESNEFWFQLNGVSLRSDRNVLELGKWWCLHNTVNGLNATEFYTLKWFKW